MQIWNYNDWFASPPPASDISAIREAEAYVVARGIEKHNFFEFAASRPKALEAWVSSPCLKGLFSTDPGKAL